MTGDVSKAPKGFKKQAFGIVLIIFGTINIILNIVTDIPVDIFDVLMIILGGVLFTIGFVQKSQKIPPSSPSS